jgi:hypothetical protein
MYESCSWATPRKVGDSPEAPVSSPSPHPQTPVPSDRCEFSEKMGIMKNGHSI